MSNKGLENRLKVVSIDFCENSTSHGVQHLSGKGKSAPVLLFWSAIFIGTIVGSSIHLYLLISSYLEYSYFEMITNDSMESLHFPHITICDPYQISVFMVNEYIEENMKTLHKTIRMSSEAYEYVENNQNTSIDSKSYINRILSKESIYANLPADKKFINGISIEQMLVWCTYGKQKCGYANFSSYIHPDYGNCYTFRLTKYDTQIRSIGPQDGLSLILKSQEINDVDPVYMLYTNIGNTVGLYVSIHEPGTVPHIADNGFVIRPGESTSIGLKQKMYKRIKTPKVTCEDEHLLKTPSGTFKETFQTCNKICKLRFILRKCGCVSTKIPALIYSDVNFCLGVNLSDVQDTMERGICELKEFVSDTELEKCAQSCLWPCSQTDYETSRFPAKWPRNAAIPDFIRKFILPLDDTNPTKIMYNLLRDHYKERNALSQKTGNESRLDVMSFFKLAMDMIMENRYSEKLINQLLSAKPLALATNPLLLNQSSMEKAQEEWVNQGFYRLNIYWSEASVEVHSQVLSYSGADLWSGVGGSLGLWSGCSIITLAECIAFIATICKVICQSLFFRNNPINR